MVWAFIATSGSLRSRHPQRVWRPERRQCVHFQGRRVRRVYVTMQITFLTRKSALIYRRGLRQRVASLTLNCNGVFAIRAYGHVMTREEHYVGRRATEIRKKRKRGRPKRRWLYRVRDHIEEKGLSAKDVYEHATQRHMSSYIAPIKSRNKMKRKYRYSH